MRGNSSPQSSLFSYVDLETRIPVSHPVSPESGKLQFRGVSLTGKWTIQYDALEGVAALKVLGKGTKQGQLASTRETIMIRQPIDVTPTSAVNFPETNRLSELDKEDSESSGEGRLSTAG